MCMTQQYQVTTRVSHITRYNIIIQSCKGSVIISLYSLSVILHKMKKELKAIKSSLKNEVYHYKTSVNTAFFILFNNIP